MSVNILLVKSYATNVYRTGRNSLANIENVRPEYLAPVMKYSAETYYIEEIDDALTKGWVTPVEHADTQALKEAGDPQHRPPIVFSSTETI